MQKTIVSLALAVLLACGVAARAHAGNGHRHETHGEHMSDEEHAFGKPGDPKKAARTIMLEMSDAMRFTPSEISVKAGETVRLVIANKGAMKHEMVIGIMEGLQAHAALMKKYPGMEHDEPYMAHVDPGRKEEIVWQFTRPGTFHFACLLPGHFEAGMMGNIQVRK